MSLAESLRGNFHGVAPDRSSRPRWVNDFRVEDFGVGEEEITVPPPVDSKVLFLESATIPNFDRFPINIGRFLQYLRNTDVHHFHGVRIADRSEDEKVLAETARLLSRIISDQPPDELIEALRQVVVSLRSHSSKAPREVVLESFEGFVDQVEGDTAFVRLKSREHGDVLYGEYPTSQLLEKGIEEQGRFLCKTVKVDGTTRVDMQAIPSVPATDEQLRAIEEKIDRVLPRDDPGIEY